MTSLLKADVNPAGLVSKGPSGNSRLSKINIIYTYLV